MPEPIKLTIWTSDDEESEISLPTKWVICSTCRGEGKSSAYLGAFTREDMDEEGPEFMEDYIDGKYDRECNACGGRGSIVEVDEDRLTPIQLMRWNNHLEEQYRYDETCRQECEMGA